ncbi:MAG: hypothetical protein JNM75_08115 [Rhodospirillales bacterium]|nr:hypothetical protein [Rhodospirillales bacterium]
MIRSTICLRHVGLAVALAAGLTTLGAQAEHPTSYAPVAITEDFATVMDRMTVAKPEITKEHQQLLEQRYDLSDRPAAGVTMSNGKPVQEGVRVKLPSGTTWDALAKMTPDDIRAKGIFPIGFLPLPHPNHAEGGMVFPKFTSKKS